MDINYNQVLAIDERFFHNTLAPAINGGSIPPKIFQPPAEPLIKAEDWSQEQYYLDKYRVKTQKDVAVIPLMGTVSRFGSWSNLWGTEFLQALLSKAASDATIRGVVLYVNSPGGTVDGTKALADTIYRFPKAIVGQSAYVASAAYWAYSQCDECLVEPQSASEVGAVGTVYIHADRSEAYAKAGQTNTVFRPKSAPNKFKPNDMEPLDEATAADIQAKVESTNKELLADVRRGRGGKLKAEALDGSVFFTDQAITLGLADRRGTIADAVQRVLQLSK